MNITFVGLGTMGSRMARRLLAADLNLTVLVHDISPLALTSFPPVVVRHDLIDDYDAATPRTVILSMPDSHAVNDLVHSTLIHLPADSTVIDTSTTTPDTAKQCAATLQARNIHFLEAPITGEKQRAEDGTLTFITSGNSHVLESVTPILKEMGTDIIYMGTEHGHGQLTKALNNTLYNISIAAMSEMLTLARKSNIPEKEFIRVVNSGTGASYGFEKFAALCCEQKYDAPEYGYPMKKAYKDMEVVREISSQVELDKDVRDGGTVGGGGGGGSIGLHLPMVEACNFIYQSALDINLGHEVKGAMIKVIERQQFVTQEGDGLVDSAAEEVGRRVEVDVDVAKSEVDADIVLAPITRKEVRAWCRQKYGSDWWVTEDKKDRMKEAKEALLNK